jgi:hypothetical protein
MKNGKLNLQIKEVRKKEYLKKTEKMREKLSHER